MRGAESEKWSGHWEESGNGSSVSQILLIRDNDTVSDDRSVACQPCLKVARGLFEMRRKG